MTRLKSPGRILCNAPDKELYEEICYEAKDIEALSIDHIFVLYERQLYSFYWLLHARLKDVRLYEGLALGLFSLEEIISK